LAEANDLEKLWNDFYLVLLAYCGEIYFEDGESGNLVNFEARRDFILTFGFFNSINL
jgi:hypothetical protein